MAQKRVHILVRGRVQGVYFRASAQREARLQGLSGWVKNLRDGTVEIVAEGEEDRIKDFVVWANNGPSTARVDDAQITWHSYTGEFTDFRIAKSN